MPSRKKPSRNLEKKRESRDAVLLRGTEELLSLGVNLEELGPTPESIRRLAELELPSSSAAQAMACWLGFVPSPQAARLLLEMEEKNEDKMVRREIRRSLFRLEQKGVPIPRPTREETSSPLQTLTGDRGYLSPVDGRGDQLVWYVKEERGGDFFVLSGVVSDQRGLIESDAGRVARPALRGLLENTRQKFSIRLLPANPTYCDLILHEAYRRSDAKRRRTVSQFPSFRMEISHQIPERIPCPVHARLDETTRRDSLVLLAASHHLLEEEELAGWLLDSVWMEEHLEATREIQDSPIILKSYQVEERLGEALQEAVKRIFQGPAREAYRRRLEMMAYYFLLDGREESAGRALAVSLALDSESEAEPVTIPFVRSLVHRSFRAVQEREKTKEKEERRSSLIVRPGEL